MLVATVVRACAPAGRLATGSRLLLRQVGSSRGLAALTNVSGRRSFYVSAQRPEPAASTKTPKAPKSAAAAKPKKTTAAKAKKAAKPKKVAKPKKKAEPKLKAWEKKDADGNFVPLPHATKPKRSNVFVTFIKHRSQSSDMHSPQYLKENGKIDAVKWTSAMAEEWRSMSDADKQPYVDEVERAQADYEKALENWRNSLTAEDIRRENAYISAQRKQGKKGVALLRDPSRPKQPMTAFLRYFADFRKNHASELASLSITEKAKRASAAYKNLSSDEREPYDRAHAEDRQQYLRELEAWKSRSSS